jgi:DNA-binding response OmpR family regulator
MASISRDYVLKPITHRELYDAIEHVLTRRNNIKTDSTWRKRPASDQQVITEYAA